MDTQNKFSNESTRTPTVDTINAPLNSSSQKVTQADGVTSPVATPQLPVVTTASKNKSAKLYSLMAAVAVVCLVGVGMLLIMRKDSSNSKTTMASKSGVVATTQKTTVPTIKVDGLQFDAKKKYGNKYANGLLPVGDSKYVTTGAKKGFVYECQANFVPASQAGAQTRGPWFTNNNTQWDSTKKSAIKGDVSWKQNLSIVIKDGARVVTTNDLPDHHTGVFPVARDDPARVYDANPNTISEQSLTYTLTGAPTYGTPQCMGGEVGVMTNGVVVFNAFDAGGRDAGAWEVQDSCDGHPQNKGEYHYHSLSRCIIDQSVSKVIGYALDGFPISGPRVSDNNYLTTDDLDECHGIVSTIKIDGADKLTYHYVMTQDFPYSVSCFRATPIQPPGRHER